MQTSSRLSKQVANDSVWISYACAIVFSFVCRVRACLCMCVLCLHKNKLKLYANPLKHMSTKLLTFIYFSPPRFPSFYVFHSTYFIFIHFTLAFFPLPSRKIQPSVTHILRVTFCLCSDTLKTVLVCVAETWKLNPLNKFSRVHIGWTGF